MVTEVKTGLLSIHLPKVNIFGLAGKARYGQSVAHGWVVPLHPLKRGLHTIIIEGSVTITTTIVVKSALWWRPRPAVRSRETRRASGKFAHP